MAFARMAGLLLIIAAFAAACSGQREPAGQRGAMPLAGDPSVSLPLPGDLPRTASTVLEMPGNMASLQQGGQPSFEDSGLILSAPVDTHEPFKGAYAVYLFAGLTDTPAALRVETKSNYKASYWIGFADWDKGAWDWSAGTFVANPVISPRDYSAGLDKFISPAGIFAVAVLLMDEIEPVRVKKLKLTLLDEITSLSATSGRWDGVRLDWVGPDEADGCRIFRRPTGGAGGWEDVAGIPDPLSAFTDHYRDVLAAAGVEYEYLVQAGTRITILGLDRWFWSDGAMAIGQRLGWASDGSDVPVENQLAVNLGNRLSFFYTPGSESPELEVLQSGSYPPADTWTHYGEGEGGLDSGPLASSMAELPAPVALLSESTTNNPLVTAAYSNSDGAFSQVATIDQSNAVSFETPVALRPGEAEIHILGMTKVPIKSIMALLWNGNANRLELMQSFDSVGRIWYIFDPDQAPWQIVTARRPDGPVDLRALGFPVYVVFCEQDSQDLVVMYLNNGWHLVSPGVACGPGPKIRNATLEGFAPGKVLYYLSADRMQLRVMRGLDDTWQVGDAEETVIVSAPAGEQISEFDIYMQGDQSNDNYAVYTIGGQVFMSHSVDSSVRLWTEPILIDPATDCRSPQIVLNGTDESFITYLVASYISNDSDGIARINFRDLRLALEEAQNGE